MRCTVTLFTAAVALAAGLSVPGYTLAQTYPPSVNQLVAYAKKEIGTIDMAAFKSALDKNEAGLIVDVREPGEYAEGYVAGAVNVPRGVIELRIWSYVGYPDNTDMARKMTLYCSSGTRCVLATKSLQDLGFSNVTAVEMRIDD